MDNQLKLDTLVELLDRYAGVYPASPSGARGWIRSRREFNKLEPEVYIEWDKTHWRYQGEHDGWTFEHHFRPVEGMPEKKTPDMNEILTEAQRRVDAEKTDGVPCEDCGEIHDDQERFISTLMQAQEAALGSDGYLILTLTPQKQGDIVVYEPELYARHMNETAKMMLEAQVIHLAFQIFANEVEGRINDIEDPDE